MKKTARGGTLARGALKKGKESLREESENDVGFCSLIEYRPYGIIFT
jgi:hypothetical protein